MTSLIVEGSSRRHEGILLVGYSSGRVANLERAANNSLQLYARKHCWIQNLILESAGALLGLQIERLWWTIYCRLSNLQGYPPNIKFMPII